MTVSSSGYKTPTPQLESEPPRRGNFDDASDRSITLFDFKKSIQNRKYESVCAHIHINQHTPTYTHTHIERERKYAQIALIHIM